MSKEKLIIIFTVLIDVIGLGIIIPVMPAYVESFNVSALTVTMLFSTFALFTFLSSPVLGAWSDKIGRRPILLISILSTSIGWLVFASAHNLVFLFLGRIIDGLAAGNFSTAQSSIADLAKDQKERTSSLGAIGAVFGVGFLIGPLLGGILSKISDSFPFWFVGALALVNFILAYFFLPETNKNLDRERKIHWNPLKPLRAAISDRKLGKLYLIWFIFNFIAVTSNSIFALYLIGVFNYGAFETGLIFSGVGLIMAFNQGYALKNFWLKRFTEKKLIVGALIIFAAGFFLMAIPKIGFFIIGNIITAFGQSILRVAITSEVVGEAETKARGQAMGVLMAIMSVAAIVAPLLAGILFEFKHFLPFIFSALLSLTAFSIVAGRKFTKIDKIIFPV
ncbi:MAG: MFS transporter [Patescibacteria group bacterium]